MRLSPHDLEERTLVAIALAREAGVLARKYFHREVAYTREAKGPQDFVSEADRAIEEVLRRGIAQAFPEDQFLGEESGGSIGARSWVVDPIDGTINFVHGVRYWCISIGFIHEGMREIGVVHDPSLAELFWSRRGHGAWCNDARISVSSCNALDEALLAAGYVPRHDLDAHLALRRRMLARGIAVKDMGAGALMLAHVAAGRYDGFYEPHMHPWDACAGLLLIEEAGGLVLDYPGPDGLGAGGRVIASAPGIFDALSGLVMST
ncbi:MAG TPA: inositol monophosphatase family protein [Casimicrobiaceae bacterium]|nr:inositol monophosphatase family protein [Casimicrobiaceae bacterium]